ncbi:hypothetical protein [Aquimarina sp. RZ0]|uniref:hypothetical protein n=1 Tax=Aquimarina sp. RZ0 TaxID=2607730 RepID=UPI0011F22CF7|nr:hypothetical protein [Aquimarina sp. RZ0]KAA1246304.1 hypothetical protein F0000_08400 [Aquimarina sp. RZ0]
MDGYRLDDLYISSDEIINMVNQYKSEPLEIDQAGKLFVRSNRNRLRIPSSGKRNIYIGILTNTNQQLDQVQKNAV